MTMSTKPKRKMTLRDMIPLLLILAAAVYFFQFTHAGYIRTVPFRSQFEKISDNIYVNKGYSGDIEEAVRLEEQAKQRTEEFFGELTCLDSTVIILCDDEKLTKKLGCDHNINSYWFPVKRNYICVSDKYLTQDILAHELTHAELYSRVRSMYFSRVPVWFNEGLAMQNDYRDYYGEENWALKTGNGENTVAPEDMDEAKEFYADPVEQRAFRYMNAKHNVSEWLKTHSLPGLIEKLNSGEDFDTAYSG